MFFAPDVIGEVSRLSYDYCIAAPRMCSHAGQRIGNTMAGIKRIYQLYRRDSVLAIFFGIFLIFHGMVILLFAGQSWGWFELRPEMTWPQDSWLFSRILKGEGLRVVATTLLVIAALGYAAGGLGLFFRADWWRSATAASAIFSSLLYFIFWNGKFQALDDQGGFGILINLAILIVVLIFQWPA